jgi:hypothetical protein
MEKETKGGKNELVKSIEMLIIPEGKHRVNK